MKITISMLIGCQYGVLLRLETENRIQLKRKFPFSVVIENHSSFELTVYLKRDQCF